MLKIAPEHIEYMEAIVSNPGQWNWFHGELEKAAPSLHQALSHTCQEHMVEHARTEAQGSELAFTFMQYATFLFGALYAANDKKFPEISPDLLEHMLNGYKSQSRREIARRLNLLKEINEEWASHLANEVDRTHFCLGSLGLILAMAEAFVVSAITSDASQPQRGEPAETQRPPREALERAGVVDPEFAKEMAERDLALSPLVRNFMYGITRKTPPS